ncbi:transcript variant X1 [Nothobranchius furzeri]|uniref:Transcript variant X1 n=1 Tax=Nothobranchius furzeri TaxID=105023 RepID=A0A9D3C2L3_NOTFU|nr:transcript variant X1 [Nothobranchius furzeri]
MFLEGFVTGMIFFLTPGGRCEEMEVIAEMGSKAVLPCRCGIKRCDPAAITWTKAGKGTVWRRQTSGLQYWGSNWVEGGTQRVRCPHSAFVHGDYGLQINSVKVEDGGVYSCRVVVGGHITGRQVMLRVIQGKKQNSQLTTFCQYQTKLARKLKMTTTDVFSLVSISPSSPMWGDSMSATCSVTPWPNGASVKWMVNNRPLWSQPRSTSNKPGSVVKERATEKVAGNWTCVFNHKKEARTTAVLSVRGIVQPPKDDTKVYAAVGSPMTLPCVFSPDLNPTSTVFEKTGVGKTLAFSRSLQTSSDASVPIQEVTSEDQGKYRCAGTVQGRRLARTMQLVVAKIIQSKKKGSVGLTCQLSDASEVTKYEWVHATYDLNGTKSDGPILKEQTIYPEHGGEWTCQYYGKEGFLGNVTTQVLTQLISSQSGQKPSNKGVVIGLSVLLVILLLILAQTYKNHQRVRSCFQTLKQISFVSFSLIVSVCLFSTEEKSLSVPCDGDHRSYRLQRTRGERKESSEGVKDSSQRSCRREM